jgi:site-specific recombinase XerD
MKNHPSANLKKQSSKRITEKSLAKYLTSRQCDESVRIYLTAALADNTLRAYRSDIQHFIGWGGALPASAESVAKYVAHHATTLSCATLSRRVVAINRAHSAQGLPSPANSNLVRATLQGVRRTRGQAQHQVAALQKSDLLRILKRLKGLRGLRDKALLLIGFSAALRRSELVSLDVEDIQFVTDGVMIRLRRSKTDQEGRGRDIAIPYVHGRHCPCRALLSWLKASGIKTGALFRGIGRYGHVLTERLTAQSVALIIKQRAASAGLNPRIYSGHSLRAGFATNAAKAGASSTSIRTQTGHQSDAMLQRYIRSSQLFTDNANKPVWCD